MLQVQSLRPVRGRWRHLLCESWVAQREPGWGCVRGVMNSGEGRDSSRRLVQSEPSQKLIFLNTLSGSDRSVPLLLQQSERSAEMKAGNAGVCRRRTDCRRIRNGINGSDKQ